MGYKVIYCILGAVRLRSDGSVLYAFLTYDLASWIYQRLKFSFLEFFNMSLRAVTKTKTTSK